ncbi:polyadenylate-binding protein-interacting protein 2B isoform X1 [Nomascus leucogenys]|uniref:polyadenylate-binding protein-interacting protein 2B isoform X1 n=1 Tax=Nomascus leucogenys TaxID=61853 RepID=UPI00122DBC63|nr:polyadenylate-binding protein-interacting protein 2B isoform X1 [Nomascus leucogenys]
MNGSNMANTSPSVKSKEDQGLSGHDEKENPFAEYMWMENEEDFNRQVEEELQEQDFLDRCFQEMLDEEDQDWFIPSRDLPQAMGQLQQQLNGLSVSEGHDSEDILKRKLALRSIWKKMQGKMFMGTRVKDRLLINFPIFQLLKTSL